MNIKIFDKKDFPVYLPKLNALYDDLFSSGKGFRSKLVQQIAGHIKLNERQIQLLSQTIEFIHNASLLHDDLVDRSKLRRSKPAAWLKYTPEYAVLAGDYLLARVMVNLSRYGNLRLIQFTSEMISDLLEGEWIQDSLIKDWDVDLKRLDQVHSLKTASLFRWCLQAPFIIQDRNEPALQMTLQEMGSILGLLFQRSDDLLDYNIRNNEGKAVLGDLRSGYLNSFGSFLCQDLGAQTRDQFKDCQSMDDVFQLLSQDVFEQKLKAFDQMNQQYIDLYQHHLGILGGFLKDDEKQLLDDLRDIPRFLYWRSTK